MNSTNEEPGPSRIADRSRPDEHDRPSDNGEGSAAAHGRAGDAGAEPAAAGYGAGRRRRGRGTRSPGADIVALGGAGLGGRRSPARRTRPRPPGSASDAVGVERRPGRRRRSDGKRSASRRPTPRPGGSDARTRLVRPCPRRARLPPSRRRGAGCRVTTAGRPPAASRADDLLDDGPTAYLEAPGFIPPPPGESSGSSAAGETGGWARATRTQAAPPGRAAAQAARPVVGAEARPGAGRGAVLHLAGRGRRAVRRAGRHGRLGPAQRHLRRPGLRRGARPAAR